MTGKRQFGEVWSKKRRDGTTAWFARWRVGQVRHCKVAGRTRKEAEAFVAARMLEAHRAALDARPVSTETTLEEFTPRILAIWKARLRARTVAPRKLVLGRAAAFFGRRPMAEVRRADVEAWCAQLALAPKTVEQHHAVLSSAWSVAIELGIVRENPCRGAKRPRVDEAAVPYLAPERLARLYAAMPEPVRAAVVLIGESGLRRGEALALRWGDVDHDLSAVTVRGEVAKSHRQRRVPLTGVGAKALDDLRASRPGLPDAPLFGFGRSYLNHAFREAADAAGFHDVTPHTLRHAYASGLVRAGVDLPTVARLLGHSAIGVTMRYAQWAPADSAQRAVEALDKSRHLPPPASSSRTAATET